MSYVLCPCVCKFLPQSLSNCTLWIAPLLDWYSRRAEPGFVPGLLYAANAIPWSYIATCSMPRSIFSSSIMILGAPLCSCSSLIRSISSLKTSLMSVWSVCRDSLFAGFWPLPAAPDTRLACPPPSDSTCYCPAPVRLEPAMAFMSDLASMFFACPPPPETV